MPHGWLNDTMPGRYRAKEAEEAWGVLLAFLGDVFGGNWPGKGQVRLGVRKRDLGGLRFLEKREARMNAARTTRPCPHGIAALRHAERTCQEERPATKARYAPVIACSVRLLEAARRRLGRDVRRRAPPAGQRHLRSPRHRHRYPTAADSPGAARELKPWSPRHLGGAGDRRAQAASRWTT